MARSPKVDASQLLAALIGSLLLAPVAGATTIDFESLTDGTGFSPNILLSVSAPGIAHVEFAGNREGTSFTLDDFSFERPEAVPMAGLR